MVKYLIPFLLAAMIGIVTAAPSFADDCSDATSMIDRASNQPPSVETESTFVEAIPRCPDNSKLYEKIGDYYVHWWKNDINADNKAIFNYLATEYYAKGIKAGSDQEVKQLRYKLAALENDTKDISAIGIRSIKPGTRLNIKVFFAFGSAELSPGAQEQLDVLGNYLKESNTSQIVLEGHTDMAGTEAYNKLLSEQRADSAKQYLVDTYHISPDVIKTQGYGYDRLANVDDPFSSKNRRVRVRKLPQ